MVPSRGARTSAATTSEVVVAIGSRNETVRDPDSCFQSATVVPETWFFRHREAFVMLGRMVQDEWLPTHAGGVLRLLSLP